MEGLKKENEQEKAEVDTVPALNEKCQYLMDELSKLMNQVSGDYGPLLMEELQRRMEVVVENFNEELNILIQSSFEKWKIKDSQLRDLMSSNKGNLQTSKRQPKKEKDDTTSTPAFIKDVKFGPIGRK